MENKPQRQMYGGNIKNTGELDDVPYVQTPARQMLSKSMADPIQKQSVREEPKRNEATSSNHYEAPPQQEAPLSQGRHCQKIKTMMDYGSSITTLPGNTTQVTNA